jgi:hypothetical protein
MMTMVRPIGTVSASLDLGDTMNDFDRFTDMMIDNFTDGELTEIMEWPIYSASRGHVTVTMTATDLLEATDVALANQPPTYVEFLLNTAESQGWLDCDGRCGADFHDDGSFSESVACSQCGCDVDDLTDGLCPRCEANPNH